MRVFLAGSSGQVGSELLGLFGATELVAPARGALDLGDTRALRAAVLAARPQLIVNAAAYTDVDGAERDPEGAMRLNRDAVARLGELACELRAGLIHYSTDFVFDGTKGAPYVEDDATNPLGSYGRSKLAGELALIEMGAPAIVLRSAWIYGLRRKSFVSQMLKLAREKAELKVVVDQVGNPTYARDLAVASAELIQRLDPDPYAAIAPLSGVYHLAGTGSTSRYDLARAVLDRDPRRAEHRVERVIPVASSEFPTPTRRPEFAPLDCEKARQRLGLVLPAWQDALERALRKDA
jgi:dTDP-4-dehydrorhamnose reductase